jgi:hypothetical protein
MSTTPNQAQLLATKLGYQPRDLALFVVALTHRSAEGPNNERLEFLGDSVLNLMLSERLYREFPTASEGDLSRLRARLVSEEPLAGIAHEMKLGELLLLGSGELKTGGFRRQSILADAFEALCKALYLDGGLVGAHAPRADVRTAHCRAAGTFGRSRTPRRSCRSTSGQRPTAAGIRGQAHQRRTTPRPSWSPAYCHTTGSRPRARGRAAGAPNRWRLTQHCGRWTSMSDEIQAGADTPHFARLRRAGRPSQCRQVDTLNVLVGEKVSIVTSRPQTTRHRVLGVLNRPGCSWPSSTRRVCTWVSAARSTAP